MAAILSEGRWLYWAMDRYVDSPCIRLCTLDLASDTCYGCGRTLREIEWWTRFSEAEREEVLARLPARLVALGAAPREGGDR